MAHPSEESLLANVPAELRGRPEARRAAELVVALQGAPPASDPFETFEALDALPQDVVRAVLASWTGPTPDPEALDEATRRAHGFPAPPLHLRVSRAMRPVAAGALRAIGPMVAEQVRVAGLAWDGRDLPAAARFESGESGGDEGAFARSLEIRWLADAGSGARVADVLTYAGDSGTVFLAGTAIVAGAIAYGVVESRDARLRTALQAALAMPATVVVEEVEALPPPPPVREEVESAQVSAANEEEDVLARETRLARELKSGRPDEVKPVRKELAAKIDALTAEVDALAARISSSTDVAAAAEDEVPTRRRPAKKASAKKASAKKASAKKVAAEAPAKKASAKKASAEAPAKKTAKKASAKKVAAEAPAKKTAKKASAAKAPAKKAAAKKTTKVPAKKAAAKKTAAKKTAKKASAAKAPAKKAAAKKTTKAPAKKAAAKKVSKKKA